MKNTIPQCDPGAVLGGESKALERAFKRVLKSGRYILGKEVAAFEKEFASFLGGGRAIGVASGTDAVELALRACGVEDGDSVLTVALTAVASVSAIRRLGAKPVFVDVSQDTLLMDPADLERKLAKCRKKPKAILVVHLYGFAADMGSIMRIARRAKVKVVEDCAQAHGAECLYRGKWTKVGRIGDAAAFSFYPTKNLPGMGDGGMVVVKKAVQEKQVRALRQYGWDAERISRGEGMNSRLDELQAAFLRVMIKRLDRDNAVRKRLAAIYDNCLIGSAVNLLTTHGWCRPVYHQYPVRVLNRAKVRKSLKCAGIDTAVHYPVPVHEQPAFRKWAREGSLPVTEKACRSIFSLPMYPALKVNEARHVARILLAAL